MEKTKGKISVKKIVLVLVAALIPQLAHSVDFSGTAGGTAFAGDKKEVENQRREVQLLLLEMQRQQQVKELQRREQEMQKQREEVRLQQEALESRQQQKAKRRNVKLTPVKARVDLYGNGFFSEPAKVLIAHKNGVISLYRGSDKALITSGKYTKKLKGTFQFQDKYDRTWEIEVE